MSSNLPVNIAEQMRQELQNIDSALMPIASNKISTKAKVFSLPNGQSSPGPLMAVILDFVQFNTYYKGAWNPNSPQMPVCWAIGKDAKALTPSTEAPEAQHTSCAGCPKDAWGSSGTGKGKACKNQYRLILATPDGGLEQAPMSLYVSPSGMKHFSNYVRDIKREFDYLPIQCITKIAFDPNAPYPTLTFALDKPHSKIEEMWTLKTRIQDMLFREPDPKQE